MKYTQKNMEFLAREVVADWDMDTLISCAVEGLIKYYNEHKEQFIEDAKEYE